MCKHGVQGEGLGRRHLERVDSVANRDQGQRHRKEATVAHSKVTMSQPQKVRKDSQRREQREDAFQVGRDKQLYRSYREAKTRLAV